VSRHGITGIPRERFLLTGVKRKVFVAGVVLQLAEKHLRVVGRGFIPGIRPIESAMALEPVINYAPVNPMETARFLRSD
jgi:hypothetical protein